MKAVCENFEEHFVLACSGRKFYANNHVLGIGPDSVLIDYGGDGTVFESEDFTAAERAEVADYMIALWTKFKEQR